MELFNVEINHPFYSLHYVAEQVPLKEAMKIAEEQSKLFCPKTVFIEKVYDKEGTMIHESTPWYDILKWREEHE